MLELGDLLAKHALAGIELRIVPALAPLWERVVASTLEFSGIRLRNLGSAAPPERAATSPLSLRRTTRESRHRGASPATSRRGCVGRHASRRVPHPAHTGADFVWWLTRLVSARPVRTRPGLVTDVTRLRAAARALLGLVVEREVEVVVVRVHADHLVVQRARRDRVEEDPHAVALDHLVVGDRLGRLLDLELDLAVGLDSPDAERAPIWRNASTASSAI